MKQKKIVNPTGASFKASPITRGLFIATLAAGLLTVLPAGAQEAAQAIHIKRQPLSEALLQIASQTSTQVVFAPDAVNDLTAPELNGNYTTEQALQNLLQGLPVNWKRNGKTITVSRAQTSSAEPVPASLGVPVLAAIKAVNPNVTPPAYAGGQVATGARLGLLGNKDIMDTPFSIVSYTDKTIQDQQATSISEVLTTSDSSVRASIGSGNRYDALTIRGLRVDNDELALNGLYGLVPAYRIGPDAVERIELLKGPGAFLNGMLPWGSVGGGVNIVTKRAGSTPLTQLTAEYASDSKFGGHLDLSRRFGENQQFGVRVNAAHRNGDTPIDLQSVRNTSGSLGLDFTTERLRLSADVMYQNDWMGSAARGYSIMPGVSVPDAPDPKINLAQRFDYGKAESLTGLVRAEYDLSDNITMFAAAGFNRFDFSKREDPGGTIINAAGDTTSVSNYQHGRTRAFSAEAGIRARFNTGPVSHQVVLSGNTMRQRSWMGQTKYENYASNIYDPVRIDNPGTPISHSSVYKTGQSNLNSIAIADTLSVLDGAVELTLGARRQQIETRNFSESGETTNHYDEGATTPSVALVVKPTEYLSLYANYIEALTAGATPPEEALNADEVFAPYKSKQYEIGAKYDTGHFGATLSLFRINMPTGIIDPATKMYGLDGEQRHQGIELNVFGELSKQVRILGGVTWMDAKLRRTQDGLNDGNHAIGAPALQSNIGLEWDTPFVPGLTLSGRAIYTSKAYASADNTQYVPSWTRFDLGGRYTTKIQGRDITFRANVTNVANRKYWESNPSGYVISGMPRMFWLSVSANF